MALPPKYQRKLFPRFSLFKMRSIRMQFRQIRMQILRTTKSLRDFLNDIDEYTRFFDGFQNVISSKRNWFERIFWFFLIWGFIYGTFYTCSVQWKRYIARPTVISLERDYRSWNGTLPAMTLCYIGRVNEMKAEKYILDKWNISTTDEEYKYFHTFVEIVANATIDRIDTLIDYEDDERFEDINFRELVLAVHPDISHQISLFDETLNVPQHISLTELGLCFVINMPMSVLLDKSMTEVTEIGQAVSCKYHKYVCFIKIIMLHAVSKVAVHSPYEVPEMDTKFYPIANAVESIRVYKIVEIVSGSAVRNLPIVQRKCVFREESIGQHGILTGNMCIVRCRAETAMELCDCRPYFYSFLDGPDCTLSGLLCLYRSFWPIRMGRVCDCPKNCNDLNFVENNVFDRVWSVGNAQLTYKSTFRAELQRQKIRLKRDIVFSFEDFLVSFGGAVSLFLGCSAWKLVRLVYILLLKIYQFYRDVFDQIVHKRRYG